MQLLFCAHFINILLFCTGVELSHFFPSEIHKGCLVCVICNSNSFHSFIFKLCTMIVHTLDLCTSYYVYISCFFSFLAVLSLDFFCKMLRGCLVCVICNTKSFHSSIFKLCIMIIHMHLVYCAHLINIFLFLGLLNLDILSIGNAKGVSGCVIYVFIPLSSNLIRYDCSLL